MNIICGINPVLEALNAGTRHFDRLLVVKGLRNHRVSETMARASQMGVPLRFEARETLDRMAAGVPHQGVIAVVSPKPVVPLDDLLKAARDPALLVILDGVEDPRNLGALLRSAEAAGVDGVLLPDRHNAGLSESVARASAGALEYVRIARIGNVSQAIDTLKGRGYWIVGLDAEGTERWDTVDYKRPIALILGGEERGMRRLVKERCDHVVALPLFGHVSSLNVSVAAGIALYEVVRQRGAIPSHVKPIPPSRLSQTESTVGPGPDDAEEDPGRGPHLETLDSPGEADAQEDDGVSFMVIHEEAAWAGPTIVKDAGGSPRRTRHEGRRHEPHEHAPQGASPEARGAPPDGSKDALRGRRRRRRRGRRGPPSPGGAHSQPSPSPVPVDGPAEGGPPAEGPAQGSFPPHRPLGASRRRRRRHRSRPAE